LEQRVIQRVADWRWPWERLLLVATATPPTVVAVTVSGGHLILVICGPGELADLEQVRAEPSISVSATRSSAIQGDGKSGPQPAHSRLSVVDRVCGAPVARITRIR
jgi:hypothetical protein